MKLHIGAKNHALPWVVWCGDKISLHADNFVTLTNKKNLGSRYWQKPEMALQTSRPWIWIPFYSEKKLGIRNIILK